MTILRERYNTLLAAIRPEALNLVDAFDIRDEVLNSALGCWDGNVYQSIFRCPLNPAMLCLLNFSYNRKQDCLMKLPKVH